MAGSDALTRVEEDQDLLLESGGFVLIEDGGREDALELLQVAARLDGG